MASFQAFEKHVLVLLHVVERVGLWLFIHGHLAHTSPELVSICHPWSLLLSFFLLPLNGAHLFSVLLLFIALMC